MTWKKKLTLALPIAILSCSAPAVYNAQTGDVAIRPASPALQQQGEKAFAQYRAKKTLSRDSSARNRVYRVANRLQSVVPLPGARWDFEVFDDSSANAFALPGGNVGINTGLLNIARTDGQLAAALAHEMAHVTSNHAQSRLQNNQVVNILGAVAGQVLGGQNPSQTSQYAQGIANIALGKSFSRAQELQADRVGMIFMAKAGYNPGDAVTLWQNMSANQRSRVPEFLSTHPVGPTRIKALQDFLPEARKAQR